MRSNQSVVFVHGVRTSSAIWDRQVEAMTAAGHHCVTVDLPGHGSRAGERFTLARAFAAIDDGVRATPSPPLLVGHSLGGYTSLAYAADNQALLSGVVLTGCSTEIRGKPLRAYREISRHVTRVLRRSSSSWHVVTEMLTALGGHSMLTDLRRLSVPVWLVSGQRDILRFGERRYLAANRETRIAIIRRVGHDVNTHAPMAFNRVLLGIAHEVAAAIRPGPLTSPSY